MIRETPKFDVDVKEAPQSSLGEVATVVRSITSYLSIYL